MIVGAICLLTHALRGLDWRTMLHECWTMPWHRVALAALFTVASYGALTIYDFIGCRLVGCGVGYVRVAYAALLAYAFSHTLGFPAVTGGAIRYRLYARWGVRPTDIARIMALAGVTLVLGMLSIGGTSMLFTRQTLGSQALGGLMLAGLLVYVAIGYWRGTPKLRVSLAQILVGSIDWLGVAGTLYMLLPSSIDMSFAAFAGLFVMAYLVATISNVPGGIGIFESLILANIGHGLPTEALVSALLVYRAIYFLVPFLLAGLALMAFEAQILSARLSRRNAGVGETVEAQADFLRIS